MRKIIVIARNTFRETVRDRILLLIIVFAVIVLVASLLAASVSLNQELRVIESFGLTSLLLFLVIITIFLGTQLMFREVERKTIYFTLTKPISREEFYLGKFLGLAATVAVAGVLIGIALVGLLLVKKQPLALPALSLTILFCILESWLLISVSLLFSAFTSPLASAVYTFALFLIGHSSTTIWLLSQKSAPALRYALEGAYYLLPNLEKFNLRNEVIYALVPQGVQIGAVVLYFIGYTSALILLGIAAFRHNEF